MLRIAHRDRGDEVDDRLTDDVVNERFLRETVHQREVIRNEHHFGYHQCPDSNGQEDLRVNAILH
jgi:hypothetical protein